MDRTEDIKKCPVCHNEVDQVEGPYQVFDVISSFLKQLGWGICALPYGKIPETSCIYEEHNWDGRWLAGITFRRCVHCGLTQRRLYRPYFEDFKLNISDDEWSRAKQGPTENLRPYSIHFWE